MALSDIINHAIQLVGDAYQFFFGRPQPFPPQFRDLWVTTSGNPCVFCRHMEQISHQVVVPHGQPFPAPNYTIQAYLNAQQLTFVQAPKAHDNCQCHIETVPI